jgi:GT2 family glycosyltransferase
VSGRETIAIVLHFRREAMTAACVRSLEQSTAPLRILIVDNESADGSAERLRTMFPQHAHLSTGANLGYAGGNVRGIEWAIAQGAERVLVINDDAEVAPEMLQQLHAALDADPQAAAAAPSIVHETPVNVVWWAGGHFDAWRISGIHEGFGQPLAASAATDSPRAVTFLSGCCLLIRTDVIQQLGAFREDFGSYVEDVELSLRYTRAGKRLLYVPAANAIHKVRFPEPAPAPWKIVNRDRNRRRVARLHFGAFARIRFYAVFAVTRALIGLGYVLRGDFARAGAIVRGALTDG